MSKILNLNLGSKGFRIAYEHACADFGVEADFARSRHCCFVLKDGQIRLYCQDRELRPEDYVFVRLAGTSTLMTSLLTQYFKARGVPISDQGYLQHTQNEEKITQMLLFALSGISIPDTVLFSIVSYALHRDTILSHISFPCVLKVNGSRGRKVWKVATPEALDTAVAQLDVRAEVAMVQAYIPNTFDIRVICIHDKIVGAIRRSSADGFLNNVSSGATAEAITITSEEEVLVRQACTVLQKHFAGVDLVRYGGNTYVFEANTAPQVYGFERATGIDVARYLVTDFKRDYLE